MMDVMTGSDGAALSGGTFWRSVGAASPAAAQALRAQQTHPAIVWLGPVYGLMEHTAAGWRMDRMNCSTPQEARDSLGYQLRVLARRRSTNPAARQEYWAASAVLETERRNEMVVAGRQFRVVRADQSCRHSALAGPEPPRPADPDTSPDDGPGPAGQPRTDWPAGGLLGRGVAPGSEALSGERWEIVPEGPVVPPGVTRDARQALTAYPQIVMLAARFAVAENTGRRWPLLSSAVTSPCEARRTLAAYFTTMVPAMLRPSPPELAAYQDAARRLEQQQRSQLTVAGRQFRIIRVETAVRTGPDGPEPPRPSDHDPDPPLTGETAELRTWNLTDD